MVRFIDREEELEFLRERYRRSGLDLIVVYGRRRVGKTEILRQFIKDKPFLYFLADKRGTVRNMLRLRRHMAKVLGEAEIATTSPEDIFKWYVGRSTDRPVVIIDEFPYLIEKDDAIPSVFQLIIDETLRGQNLMLILCGSSVGMMEEIVLGSKSPLYGRKTGHWKVLPLSVKDSRKFFPGIDMKRAIEFYSVLGGVPFYLEKFSGNRSTQKNIEREILSKSGHLYEEVDFLLKEELREPDVYKAILEAIATGRGKVNEISQSANIPVQDIDKYLKVLMRLGFIKKLIPITERKKSKRTRYVLSDPLFGFWFTFCESYKSDLEIGTTGRCLTAIKTRFPAFVGKAFEEFCIEFITRCFPGKWPVLGPWWGARRIGGKRVEEEMDIVGLNNNSKEILFAECKWKDNVNPHAILARLKAKAELVGWRRDRRSESFAIFARSFKRGRKTVDAQLFDLRSIEKALREEVGKGRKSGS